MRRNNRNQYNRGGQQQQQNQIQTQYEQSFISENVVKQENAKPIQSLGSIMPQQQLPPVQSTGFTSDTNGSTKIEMDDAAEKKKWKLNFGPKRNLTAAQKKEKKRQQNRRLRKLLIPKNAVVALNELRGPEMGEFSITAQGTNSFVAEIVLNNVKYSGHGTTKQMAKLKASEKALRDLVITQMSKLEKGGESNTESEDVEMKSVSESDDIPMIHLASFALHKLFNEWQNEGFEIPELNGGAKKVAAANTPLDAAKPAVPSKPKVLKTISDIPPDASKRHPASLLAYMRPQSTYVDLGSTGAPPSVEFTIGVTVDEREFIGKGKSKKIARRNAAAEACQQIWGTEFEESAMTS